MSSKKSQNKISPSSRFRNFAIVLLIFDAFLYTVLSVVSRVLNNGFAPMTQVYLRIGLGFLIALLLFRHSLRWQHIKTAPKRDWMLLLLMGTVGYGVAVWAITVGAIMTKLANLSVIVAMSPFFSHIYSRIAIKSPLQPKLLLLALVSFYGISVVATKSFVPSLVNVGIGELYVLLTAATGTWFFVGRKMLTDHLNNSEITTVVMAIAALAVFVFSLINGETVSPAPLLQPVILIALFLGAGLNILSNRLEMFAFRHIHAGLGSQILLSETAFALAIGFLLYAETPTVLELFGGVIILISVFLTTIVQKENDAR